MRNTDDERRDAKTQRGNAQEIDLALGAAVQALGSWDEMGLESRTSILKRYAELVKSRRQEVAHCISTETGKPLWESLTEADAMAAKVAISIEAQSERRGPTEKMQAEVLAATRYKPIGVMAVFGPFNMPGHLPNGHIVPALLAGNTVVFKPSELTPAVGAKLVELLECAGVPAGVVNLVQGGREIGAILARHPSVNGVLFTGSVAGGLAISRSVVDQPGKIVALEMGGNTPLVVWDPIDIEAAAYLTIQSAYITSGQRCSCARRLIVRNDRAGDIFVQRLIAMIRTIRVGPFAQTPEPFMGPVISDAAAAQLLEAQQTLIRAGGVPLVEMKAIGPRPAMLSPGLIDVTPIEEPPDAEVFGPLLQLIRVPDFDAALAQANATRHGLAAGLLCDDVDRWNLFYRKIRAGVVHWNRQTTGASSQLPFGGIGLSGNYRPGGYWAADYCSYPVASMESPALKMPATRTPGIG